MKPSRQKRIDWFHRMFEVANTLPADALEELKQWERNNLNGNTIATSDWPGWQKHGLSPPPWRQH